jgi:hypothetical protein
MPTYHEGVWSLSKGQNRKRGLGKEIIGNEREWDVVHISNNKMNSIEKEC